jgi:hypothetical protein
MAMIGPDPIKSRAAGWADGGSPTGGWNSSMIIRRDWRRSMRNIYDQYHQPENRLTHALVCTLHEEPGILRQFVKWITGNTPTTKIKVVEQRLPGEDEIAEEQLESRGLPDAWLHDDEGWSLLIECKIASPLEIHQLERHIKTARKRGFTQVQLLAVTVELPTKRLPDYVVHKCWREIYSWMNAHAKGSRWTQLFVRYLETAESRLTSEGYLREGTLTEFNGFDFDDDNPFSYPEAKRLLKLAMDELRGNKRLLGEMGIDPIAPGRGAITGKSATGVWDLLRLKHFDASEKHTSQPHLTLALRRDHVSSMLTLPNSMQPRLRRNLVGLREEGFFSVISEVNSNLDRVIRKAKTPGAIPRFHIAQRHFSTRRAKANIDGEMQVDLRTTFPSTRARTKFQPQWLAAAYALIANKNSNLECQIGTLFPSDSCQSQLHNAKILDAIAESWIATKPLLDAILE